MTDDEGLSGCYFYAVKGVSVRRQKVEEVAFLLADQYQVRQRALEVIRYSKRPEETCLRPGAHSPRLHKTQDFHYRNHGRAHHPCWFLRTLS